MKGFDIVAFGLGSRGNKIWQGLRRLDIAQANYPTKALGRWTGPGTSNNFPRLVDGDPNGNFTNPSAFYLESGAYFRIKNLQIGYSLPQSLISQFGIQKVRFYVSGYNLSPLPNMTAMIRRSGAEAPTMYRPGHLSAGKVPSRLG